MDKTVWGIDLGTTYSCVARVDEYGRAIVVNNTEGLPTTPSVVYFESADKLIVGEAAKRMRQSDPELVCEFVKRYMGDRDWRFPAHDRAWSAIEISAFILRQLAREASETSGETVTDVVITVPAYFGMVEREATRAAGQIAGLNVVDIINEPTAAAFSYGFARQGADDETVLVYDLGGGTFDITVIRVEHDAITVVATDGNHRLGGIDWDDRLIRELARRFQEAHPDAPDPLDDTIAAADLRAQAEMLKRKLSTSESVTQMVFAGSTREAVSITRQEFEAISGDLLQTTLGLTHDVLAQAAEKGVTTIDRVLLVGGSSFMPAVASKLAEEFDWTPKLENPNLAVALGAALAGQSQELRDRAADELAGKGVDLETATPEQIEEAVQSIAPEAGITSAAALRLVNTRMTNVLSRGFGVMLLKQDADPASQRDEDHLVEHLVKKNDPLPLEPPATLSVCTTVPDQRVVHLVVMEQDGSEPSELVADNRLFVDGHMDLPGDDPIGTEMEVEFRLSNSARLTVTLRHPRVRVPLVLENDTGAVVSAAEISASQARIAAITHRS